MSPIIARSAFRAAPRMRLATPLARRWATSAAGESEREAGKEAIKAGAKRDPELYVRTMVSYICRRPGRLIVLCRSYLPS